MLLISNSGTKQVTLVEYLGYIRVIICLQYQNKSFLLHANESKCDTYNRTTFFKFHVCLSHNGRSLLECPLLTKQKEQHILVGYHEYQNTEVRNISLIIAYIHMEQVLHIHFFKTVDPKIVGEKGQIDRL